MNKKKSRESLVMRLQPTSGTLLAEVIQWLKSMSTEERNQKIAEVMVIGFLPYARQMNDGDKNSVESCYWDTHNRLNQYAYVMRQKLGVKEIRPEINMFSSVALNNNVQIRETEAAIEEDLEMDSMFEVLR